MNKHKTEQTIIKMAPVDEEMVDFINWLNSYDSVVTLYCCQGEDPKKGQPIDSIDKPYVLWLCWDSMQLIEILDIIGSLGDTQIIWDKDKMQIRYVTRFQNKRCMKRVTGSNDDDDDDDLDYMDEPAGIDQ